MPDFSLPDALAEASASAPSDEIILHTLEMRHPAFSQPVRVVKDPADFNATLEPDAPVDGGQVVTFVGAAFEFHNPPVERASSPEIEIEFDNVAGDLVPYLDATSQSTELIQVTYRPYLTSDPTAPQINPPPTLNIRRVSADVFRIRAWAGYADLANRKFPSEVYDAERFPGLAA